MTWQIHEKEGGWIVEFWSSGDRREVVCATWPEVLILLSDRCGEPWWAAHVIGMVSAAGPVLGLRSHLEG